MTLPMPPQPGASPAETLLGQYAYLYQLAGQLNLALSAVENRQITVEMAASSKADSTALAKEVQSLRALILKSADTVRAEMDRLEAELKGSYVAASEFGSYVEQLSLYLEANPEAVTQYYKFAAELQGAVDRVDADLPPGAPRPAATSAPASWPGRPTAPRSTASPWVRT